MAPAPGYVARARAGRRIKTMLTVTTQTSGVSTGKNPKENTLITATTRLKMVMPRAENPGGPGLHGETGHREREHAADQDDRPGHTVQHAHDGRAWLRQRA
jgi:hypothetical protein